MSYTSSSKGRSRRRISAAAAAVARTESLEPRRLLAAEIGVSSTFGPAISDGDNTPSESDGTDFGTAFVGGQWPFLTYQVTNTSPTDDLQLSGLTAPAGFRIEQNLPDLLGPGASGFFTLSLLDTEQTTRSGQVQFTTNVPGTETFNFAVTGTLAPATVQQENDFEDVPSFTDQDVVQREEGAEDNGVPFQAITNQLLRFNIPAGEASTRFAMNVARTGTGATGDAELLVLRDADDDSLLDLNELAAPVTTLATAGNDLSVEKTATLAAGRYFGLVRVTNFAADDPSPPLAGVSLDYTLSTSIQAVRPADVAVSVGGAIVGDGDVSPSEADGTNFGSVAVGQSAPQRAFTVTNTGDQPATLGTVTATGGFEVVSGLPASLAAGQSATFTIRMPTAAAGAKAGEVSFATNVSAKNPYNFAIAGTVNGITPEITVSLDGGGGTATPLADGQAQAVDFGSVVAGQPAGVARTFIVRNDGGTALSLGAPTLPAGFELTEPLATSLAPGASDSFTVTLTSAGAAGARSGTMSVPNGDADENPFDVPLAGLVVAVSTPPAPEITVIQSTGGEVIADGQANPVDFGSSLQGGPGASRTFVVRNDGTAPLDLPSVTVPEGFVITDPLATTLAAGGFDAFTVAASTVNAGGRSGAVVIANNDADENPFEFNVTGAVGQASASGSEITVLLDGTPLTTGQTIDFGDVAVGATAPERTLTIRNDGDAALTLGQVTVPAGYTLVQGPAVTTLAPDASTTVRISMSTAAAGSPAGQTSIANSDADENPFLLTLTGSVGTPSAPSVVTVTNVTAKVPAVVIAGDRKARGTVAFRLTNASSTSAFAGPVTFVVAASADNSPGPADFPLLSVTRNVKLKAAAGKTIKLKVVFPANTPQGNQTLIVSATAAGTTGSGVGPVVSVQEPFVQLVGVPAAAPLAKPVTYGRPVRLSIPLTNAGNVPTSRMPATYALIVSTDGTGAGKVFETTAVGRVSLKAGQTKPQRLSVTFAPGSFAPGSYTLIVRLANAELNQTNGQTVALIPFTIA